MDRISKVNKHIQRVLGEVMQKHAEIPGGLLVTISKVETAPNLRTALVWLYINPSGNGERILKLLQDQIYELQGYFNEAVRLHPLPRLSFKEDHGAEYAQHISSIVDTL